jgi:hypothetical protein
MLSKEGEEPVLELAAGWCGCSDSSFEDCPQGGCPGATGMACEKGGEGERVGEPLRIGALDRALQRWGSTTAARSKRVRFGVVTGIPSAVVTSSGGSADR